MKRIFCVQPYGLKRHKLAAGGALVFDDLEDAASAGRKLARSRAGVVVLSQDMDARSGLLSKPRIVAIHGRVPASWYELGQRAQAA